MKIFSFIISLVIILGAAGPALGEWPERGLTLVTSNPRTVTWSQEEPDTRAELLKALTPRLSRELGVPVSLIFRSDGSGILAGNMVAEAKPDGYVFGALGGDTAMARVIQEFTPYNWSEFVPVSTAWRTIYAVVARAELEAADLREVAAQKNARKLRLAYTGLYPIEVPTFLAIRSAQKLGFSWQLTQVDALNPEYLLNDEADAMVMPLGSLAKYPERDKLKVLLIFTRDDSAPCARGLPTLTSQDLAVELNPPFAFYLPAKVNWRIRSRLSLAINRALGQPAVRRGISEACLDPVLEDVDSVAEALNREYKEQETLLGEIQLQVQP